MIEHRHFDILPTEDLGWLKVRHHLLAVPEGGSDDCGFGCMRAWDDEELAPNTGIGLHADKDIEIITYVREGTITHRDSLGNEGRVEAGAIQVTSAGSGIRHAEYNLEQAPARIFQIWIKQCKPGGSPAWAMQPCPTAERMGCFVVLASGIDSDQDALPLRAHARVLNARLKEGQWAEHELGEAHLAYLVLSSGSVDINGVRVRARDGAAIRNVAVVRVTAIEDADVVIVDVL